jgi:hypothetical protein
MTYTTPILLLVFNRIETTRLVFEVIRTVKPQFLYIASDGPRWDRVGEKEKCAEVREFIRNNIDWQCNVKTLFRDENLGCGRAISSAIDWFFEHEEAGIILEDDCLPSNSFFYYCSELLKRYKNDDNIMIVSGFNELGEFSSNKADYFFTKSAGIWGWATWKRAWKHYDFNIPGWGNSEIQTKCLKLLYCDSDRYEMKVNMDRLYNKDPHFSSWDYQWWFCRLVNEGLGIVPTKNLIKNMQHILPIQIITLLDFSISN